MKRGQAADDDARTFGRKVIGVGRAGEAVDQNARNALQGLGDGTIGKRADVLCGNRIDDGVGIALDLLRVARLWRMPVTTIAPDGEEEHRLNSQPRRPGSRPS